MTLRSCLPAREAHAPERVMRQARLGFDTPAFDHTIEPRTCSSSSQRAGPRAKVTKASALRYCVLFLTVTAARKGHGPHRRQGATSPRATGCRQRRGQPRTARRHLSPTRGSRSDGRKAPRSVQGSRPSRGGLPRQQRTVRSRHAPNVQVFGPSSARIALFRRVARPVGDREVSGRRRVGAHRRAHAFARGHAPHPRLASAPDRRA